MSLPFWFLAVILLSACPLVAKSPAGDNKPAAATARYRDFAKKFSGCLKKKDRPCLESMLPGKVYFPEQRNFGCATADREKGWHATPAELVECALTSTIRNASTSEASTLGQVLAACFADGTRFRAGGKYFETRSGYLCHLEEQGGNLVLGAVNPGP